MTDLNQPAGLAPLEQARLSAELLTVRAQLQSGALSPLEQARASARALELRALLGAKGAPAAAPVVVLTGTELGEFPDTPEGKKDLRAAVKAHLEGLRGKMVDCPVLGAKVEIRQRGIKESLAFSGNPKKLKLLHAIPQIITAATEAQRSENNKRDTKPDVVAYYDLKSTATLGDEHLSVRVVIEQDSNGLLHYDLMINSPTKKAMLDSTGRSPDHYSGHPVDAECIAHISVEDAAAAVMLDDVGGQLVLNLFLENEQAEAVGQVQELSTGLQVQKNGSVLVTGDPVALAAYVATSFDGLKVTQTDQGVILPKAKAGLAEIVPTTAHELASGAIVYEHGNKGGGASIAYQGYSSGIARDLLDLKGIMAREWGPEKYQEVFGEEAGADDVAAYQEEQQAIADRKAANVAAEADRAAAPERERQEAAEQAAAEAAEIERIRTQREAEQRADFEKTIGAGVAENPVYQAYLDTQEELPTFEDGNSAFLGWAGIRVGEFEAKVGGRVGNNRDEYLAYLREYAEAHLSERVRAQRAAKEAAPPLEQRMAEPGDDPADEYAAKAAGFESFHLYAQSRIGKPPLYEFQNARAQYKIVEYLEKHGRADRNTLGSLSLQGANAEGPSALARLRQAGIVFNNLRAHSDPFSLAPGVTLASFIAGAPPEPVDVQGREGNPGPGEAAPAVEIVEYTTRKGKTLRGIIRTDLSLEQAKAIDPYTWKMNGGYFIREKHLGGDTSHIEAAPAPVVMSAEQQAEALATAQRLAEERAQQALADQVEKLRQVANSAIEKADAALGASRKTNTAKRAREAGYALDNAEASKAAAKTLNRVADAIEVGAGGALAKLSSRAQLEELQRLMRLATYEADSKLGGREQSSRRGRPFEDNDLKYLVFPRPWAWSNRFANAAKTMAQKAPTGNSRLIAALAKLGNGPERVNLDATSIALTRKAAAVLKAAKDNWDLADPMEAIARVDRLERMGITDTASLVAAVQALIPHLVEKAEEDPVKKAERAIVGQKVGIDFFPTPAHVAQRMARLANIREGMRVLEPSAGNGNLADAAKAEGGVVDVIEISSQLRDILTAKGYNVVDQDFTGFKPEQPYGAILMNPPFSNRQDATHIMQAFGMLAGGGTLVAIAGEGVFFGKDQKAVAFRDWLEAHGAEVEPLEGGTFKDSALLAQTGANARLIVIHK